MMIVVSALIAMIVMIVVVRIASKIVNAMSVVVTVLEQYKPIVLRDVNVVPVWPVVLQGTFSRN